VEAEGIYNPRQVEAEASREVVALPQRPVCGVAHSVPELARLLRAAPAVDGWTQKCRGNKSPTGELANPTLSAWAAE